MAARTSGGMADFTEKGSTTALRCKPNVLTGPRPVRTQNKLAAIAAGNTVNAIAMPAARRPAAFSSGLTEDVPTTQNVRRDAPNVADTTSRGGLSDVRARRLRWRLRGTRAAPRGGRRPPRSPAQP